MGKRPSDGSTTLDLNTDIMGTAPPKPRSLILDLFGEYLRFVDAEVWLGHLTKLLGDFGIAPPTVRMTLTRLRREGWFVSKRTGRETRYRLTAPLLHLLEEGRERIFAAPPTSWSGEWTMIIYQLSEGERLEREQLRKRLAYQGFGNLGTSTWLAPGDRRSVARELSAELADGQVEVLRCLSDGLDHDRVLADRCWDLPALGAEYEAFVAQHRSLATRAAELRGPEALVARTLLVSQYRHFPFKDPQLPPPLRPDPWPGEEAYLLFSRLHSALGPAARAYVGEVIGRVVLDTDTAT
jgi:phenylacetic acid degradation operon negative regulatory protein